MSSMDNMYNSSSNVERSTTMIISQTSWIVLTTALILIGNVINFWVLHTSQLWHRSTTLLLKNLSIVDFCIGLIFTIPAIYPSAANLKEWPYGDQMCNVTSFIGGTCCGASILTLALISIDRYIIILQPLDYQRHLSVRKVYFVIILAWLIPAGLHTCPLLNNGYNFSYYNQAAFLCTAHYSEFGILTGSLVICVFIPTNVVTIISYCPIIRASLRHSKLIRSNRVNESDAVRKDKCHIWSDKSNKAILTLLTITIVFNLCWAPTVFSVILEIVAVLGEGSPWVEFLFAWLAMSNSFCNTFVYLVMNSKYRQAVRKLFRRKRVNEYVPQHTLSSNCFSTILDTKV